MRILLDTRLSKVKTGTGRVTDSLIKSIITIDNKNEYILIFHETDPFPQINKKNVKKIMLKRKAQSRLTMFWEIFILPILLWKEKVDILFSVENMFYTPFFKGISIISIMDIIPVVIPKYYNRAYDRVKVNIKLYVLKLIKKKDYIFTISNFSKKDISKNLKIPLKQIKVIPLAYTPTNIKNSKKIIQSMKIKFPYILAIGGAEKRKNNKRLLDAYKMIAPQINEHIVVVGKIKRDEESSVFDKLPKSKKIHFVGRITDEELYSLYKNATVFAYLSYYEGFGLPILEAYQYRVPVLIANITSTPEIAKDGAITTDPFDTNDIKEKLLNLLNDKKLQNKLKQKQGKILEKYDWDKSAKSMIELFEYAYKKDSQNRKS